MTYPNAHLYLTAHWDVAGTAEHGQFGLRFDSTTPATQALVDNAASAVSTMWSTVIMSITQKHRLSYLRLASIGTDGKYVPGTVAYDHNYSGTVPGGVSPSNPQLYPLQVAHVMTLHTAFARGQAHAGRVYLPPLADVLDAGYNWAISSINSRNNTFSAMCTALNGVMPGPLSIFSKGTKAAPTVGAKHVVTQINADTRPDVQRRRAKQQTSSTGTPGNV